jgi:hypothetical protein
MFRRAQESCSEKVQLISISCLFSSIWETTIELRQSQRENQEKDKIIAANAEEMARDKERIAALEARLALSEN